MDPFLLTVILVLLVTLLIGLVRVVRGPTPTDSMMAAQLMGSTGLGLLIMFARMLNMSALVNVALVFALLAAVTTVAFVRGRRPATAASREETEHA